MSEYKEKAKTDTAEAATEESKDILESGIDDDDSYIIEFKKPFVWEDQTYTKIDLSGMEDLSARDMIQVQREMQRSGGGVVDTMPEISVEYACIFAAKATQMPEEFFQALPAREAIKIKNKVMNFFYGNE